MDIRYHTSFTKAFLKLPSKIREKVKRAIETFQDNPHNPELNNHALHGKLRGKRSISVGGDMRIIFVEESNYEIVELQGIGTHSQVYK